MIVYGTKAVHVKTAETKTITCESCGKQGFILLHIYRKHFHVFWIPIFPIGKKGISECQHCKNTLETKEMPNSLKEVYQNSKMDAKGPIWQFAGLAIIAALIAWGSYASGKDKKLELEYIAAPKAGDIYKYKLETGEYSTLKVLEVTKDSILFSPNEMVINRMSKVYRIDKPENYSKEQYIMSVEKLNEMYNSGEIYDIDRD